MLFPISDALAAGEAASAGGMESFLVQVVPLIVIFVVFWFFLIRPQNKREKEVSKMREALEVGDEVITRGGIIGRVVNLKDDYVMIETGSDRTKMRIARWAIDINTTAEKEK